ncbi:DUF3592 domain-containing protein [Chitinophaga sedimenti]|uniref:DUF3592 domain-containing protein n=1 Tax=Chitinophaga sedimenti TaxID=2033606 RepID=UPI002004A741|nr:DUF3592 domain-containing protein [Chitinophaga sedimenti]MCK7556231.1 DUF3592 domain-containing protein [Chitinophaga sedimenti]
MEDIFYWLFTVVVSGIMIKKIIIVNAREVFKIIRQRRIATKTTGIVVDFNVRVDPGEFDMYASVVVFKVEEDNKEYTIVSDNFDLRKPSIGEIVSVFYDPENPLKALINPSDILNRKILMLVILSIILIGINVYAVIDLLK